jgi:dihydroneopterin aldolase
MMDIVFIEMLKVDAIIGVYDWERDIKQTLVFDIKMGFDISRAASTDDISCALDYSEVSKRITEYVQSSCFNLIETLAENCAVIILKDFNALGCHICVRKLGAVANAQSVGVMIERGEKLSG